jgi:hypothetical protein
MIRPRGAVFCFVAVATLAPATARAQVTRNPPDATVFIRVIGTARVEVEGAFAESRQERDVELGTGSGFIFTSYGHVLTNHHVIESSTIEERLGSRDARVELSVDRIEVILPNGNARFEASIETVDPVVDLAVLSIVGADLPYLPLGDSDAAAQGDPVRVYGFPFGREVEVGQENVPDIVPRVSSSSGSLSAMRTDALGAAAYLQTSATVNPGNSGGPMVDEQGYVLGVVRLKLRDADGIGFAIPVNAVKDFLTFNGYEQLLPVERLRLGEEHELVGKGVALRLPDALEDVSPMRLRAFSDPADARIRFLSDRVVSPWSLEQLEQALLAGGTFGAFQATTKRRATQAGSGSVTRVSGRAYGIDASVGEEASIEYLILAVGAETLIVRYEGPADAVAFNRSVLVESLRSVGAANLLSAEILGAIPVEQLSWRQRFLPVPSDASLVVPEAWEEEISAPFACGGLPAWASALSLSPPGDFTVSFRSGWWPASTGSSPTQSARACSDRRGALGEASYSYTVDWLGETYVVEGLFVERDGTLQLEVVAPVQKHGFVRDAAREWMNRNR